MSIPREILDPQVQQDHLENREPMYDSMQLDLAETPVTLLCLNDREMSELLATMDRLGMLDLLYVTERQRN